MRRKLVRLCATTALPLVVAAGTPSAGQAATLDDIKHIIVIYMENRSFDNLYGAFPGADGLLDASDTLVQVDTGGRPFDSLPPVMVRVRGRLAPDPRFPLDLPNAPFGIDPFSPLDGRTGDLTHTFWQEQGAIDGGRMDKFAAYSGAGGLPMGFYDGSGMRLWDWAKRFTLADHFFHAAFGGSFLNHFWLVCACTPRYVDAPQRLKAQSAETLATSLVPVTADGYAVGTLWPATPPQPAFSDGTLLLPEQDMPTIGDRLSEKGVDWAWYAGGWNDAVAGRPDRAFQFHHQPFAYFRKYAEGTDGRARHLKDYADFRAAIAAGTLPPVAFYKPLGSLTEHPGFASIAAGDAHVAEVLSAIEQSPVWKDSLVVVTSDENGGFWDHEPPPKIDRWGPGVRVPTLIVSPFARRGYVDHSVEDTTSILRLIEKRFGLEPLATRDRDAADMTSALEP